MSGKYLTIAEIAERWICSKDYVRKLIISGQLSGTKLADGKSGRMSCCAMKRPRRSGTWRSCGCSVSASSPVHERIIA